MIFQRDTAFKLALRLTMRRILATLAVVGALLFSAGSAWKAEAGDYNVHGAGALSCGTWTKDTNEKRALSSTYHNWLLGYITAYNRWGPYYDAPGVSGISKGTDIDALFAWMDNWCRDNPLEHIVSAAELLIIELAKLKGN